MAAMLKLLERQLGLYEVKRRLEEVGTRRGRCLEGNVAYGPCLLLSRERGSGGGWIARIAGKRLDWHVFDREIVDDIAQLSHVRQELLGSVDPETRASWEEDAWKPELQPEDIGCEQYLRCLRQVVLALGHRGDVVIVGRGAQWLLPDRCALRVRIIAPFEFRVRRVAESHKVSLAEAQAHIEHFDACREDFVRKCFQRDPNFAPNYDLVVNTGNVTVGTAAEMVLLALQDKLGVSPPKW